MTWHQIGTKPLSDPMVASCPLDTWEHISLLGDVMKWKKALLAIVRGTTGDWWIPLTKASDAEL